MTHNLVATLENYILASDGDDVLSDGDLPKLNFTEAKDGENLNYIFQILIFLDELC